MKLPPKLLEAIFVSRLNRFAALVRLEGSEVVAHVPNSGRLRELFTPGRTVYLTPQSGPHRKTNYDLCLVAVDGLLVSCDARLPSRLVEEALRGDQQAPFRGYPTIEREVVFGESRLDLRLSGPGGYWFVEAKSITLVSEGTALFPDALTTRGARHLRTLMQAIDEGHRGAVVFVVQRKDAKGFSSNDGADREFAATLREASAHGVGVYAYGCQVSMTEIVLAQEVPVHL